MLIETGVATEAAWGRTLHDTVMKDCAVDTLVANLAEIGGYSPQDAQLFMLEQATVELSKAGAEEGLEIAGAREILAAALARMQVCEDTGDVEGYLEALAIRETVAAELTREERRMEDLAKQREAAEQAVSQLKVMRAYSPWPSDRAHLH